GALLQRILPSGYQATYAVLRSRIGTSALGKGALFHAPSLQLSRQGIVSFGAPRLVINSILFAPLSGELLAGDPRPGPHRRIVDRDLVFEGVRPGARPALGLRENIRYYATKTRFGH